MKKLITLLLITATSIFAAQVRSLDRGQVDVSIVNNKANVLNFPFNITDAKLVTQDPKDFQIKAKRNTIIVVASTKDSTAKADLVAWSDDGYTYLIRIDVKGEDQLWNFTTNRRVRQNINSAKFETGKIERDIKKLLKAVELEKNIPGYKKTKVKKQFTTNDLLMQKDLMYDGGKYRVEKWYLKNITDVPVTLDEGAFYTKGVLSISFQKPYLNPEEVGEMLIIIDKGSIVAPLSN